MATAALVVGAVAAVGGTALSIKEGRKAERAGKQEARIRKVGAEAKNARSRRQQVAAARRARAATEAQAASSGISGGSGELGATASLDTQLATNLSFSNQLQFLDQESFKAQSSFQKHSSKASTAQQIGSTFSNAAFSLSGNFE